MAVRPRGCGTRVMGGIYACTDLDPEGYPLEDFLIDPPHRVDVDALRLSPIGVQLAQRPDSTVWDIYDWVGSKHYPNVADVVEEVRHQGLSRRLARNLSVDIGGVSTSAYDLLSAESRIILVHARAWIDNHVMYYPDNRGIACPTENPTHGGADGGMCAGLWWDDLEAAPSLGVQEVERIMPGGWSYTGRPRPDDLTPQYQPAAFLALPINRLVVIRDPLDDTHRDALEHTRNSRLPVDLEDE